MSRFDEKNCMYPKLDKWYIEQDLRISFGKFWISFIYYSYRDVGTVKDLHIKGVKRFNQEINDSCD